MLWQRWHASRVLFDLAGRAGKVSSTIYAAAALCCGRNEPRSLPTKYADGRLGRVLGVCKDCGLMRDRKRSRTNLRLPSRWVECIRPKCNLIECMSLCKPYYVFPNTIYHNCIVSAVKLTQYNCGHIYYTYVLVGLRL